MDTQSLRQKLKTIILDLQKLLQQIEPEQQKQEFAPERINCPVCGEFLDDGLRIVRGVHERCYQRLRREKRLADAEEKGVLLPKGSGGRPKDIDLDQILNSNNLMDTALKKTSEHAKTKKTGKQ